MERGFAESTIDATRWLIAHAPDRLAAWLKNHPPGDVLEKVARDRMAKACQPDKPVV